MKQIDREEFSATIGSIYDCVLDRTLWLPTIKRIGGAVRACAGNIFRHGQTNISFQYGWGTPDHWQYEYRARFITINPLATAGWHFEPGEPFSLSTFMDPAEFKRSEFYKKFSVPLGWLDFAAVVLERTALEYAALGFSLPEEAGLVSQKELSFLRSISPHLLRAARIQGLIDRETIANCNLASALDLIVGPVLVLGRDAKCLYANKAARNFLVEGNNLKIVGGRVLANNPEVSREIASAASQRAVGLNARNSFVFDRGTKSFIGYILPLSMALSENSGMGSEVTCVLFLQQVGALQPMPGDALVKLYGLTPAETRLLVLIGHGFTLHRMTELLGITMPTVRSHLKQIFAKTRTSRQSELVKLVLSALPPPP